MQAGWTLVCITLLGTTSAHGQGKERSGRSLEGVVNLNAAAPDELRLLPGIGPSKIRNILFYRKLHPFRTVDELVRIKGIGHKMVRRLRLHLAVSGPSTAQQVIRPAATTVIAPPITAPHPPVRNPIPLARSPPGHAHPPRLPFPRALANHCRRGA